MTPKLIPVLFLAGGLAIAGCGSSSGSSGSTTTVASTGHPAGSEPSASAKMICSDEAQTDIAASIGVKATVSTPTWVDDVYSCDYAYTGGATINLSVKELNDAAETTKEYNAFAAKLGRRPDVVSFGQGAFITTDGSVIVRKDFKVLFIDVSKLPLKFGTPAQDRSNVALSVAATVMSCWTGA